MQGCMRIHQCWSGGIREEMHEAGCFLSLGISLLLKGQSLPCKQGLDVLASSNTEHKRNMIYMLPRHFTKVKRPH